MCEYYFSILHDSSCKLYIGNDTYICVLILMYVCIQLCIYIPYGAKPRCQKQNESGRVELILTRVLQIMGYQDFLIFKRLIATLVYFFFFFALIKITGILFFSINSNLHLSQNFFEGIQKEFESLRKKKEKILNLVLANSQHFISLNFMFV